MKEKIILAWSGGKDSALALDHLRRDERWEVAALLTSVTGEYQRISMHGVRESLLDQQAESLGLPLTKVFLSPQGANEEYENLMTAALLPFKAQGINRVAFGDLFLADVRAYREKNLARIGMSGLFPLWGLDTAALAQQFVARGFKAVITCVDTQQLDGSFAGRTFDAAFVADLPAGPDPCGENGEFHSFVYDGPIFRKPIPLLLGEKVLRDGRFFYCDLLPEAA